MNEVNIEKVDLNLLKSLQALLLERHVGNAAKRMHVSQSAMSHTLARLRDTFSDPLFVRTSKGLEPTTRALSFAPKLAIILEDISTLLEPERFEPANIDARFRLQTHNFITARYLSTFFNNMRQVAPGLIFETYAVTEYSYQQLDSGEIDLIIAGGSQAPAHFKQRRIIEERSVCLIDKKHPARKQWDIENFLRYPHIKNTLLREKDDRVTQGLKKNNLPARKFGFYSHDMLTHAVVLKDSNLIATLPLSLAKAESEQYGHVLMPCPIDLPDIQIKAIWHERSHKDSLHQWVRDQLALTIPNQVNKRG